MVIGSSSRLVLVLVIDSRGLILVLVLVIGGSRLVCILMALIGGCDV